MKEIDINSLPDFLKRASLSKDPFTVIYRALTTNKYGDSIRVQLQHLYDEIAVTYKLDPDENCEQIIDIIIQQK